MCIYFSSYKRHNVLLKSRKHKKTDQIYAHMMAFILPVSHLSCLLQMQIISADLFSHPKVREMFRKCREINRGLKMKN